MEKMAQYGKRGYYVMENGPIYFTSNMDKTLEWFQKTLGWYGDICSREAAESGSYGCVYDCQQELMDTNVMPFKGFHLFHGQQSKGLVGFVGINGIDKLYNLVKANGWNEISEIEAKPWGSKACTVTTIDGSKITFFELD